MLHYALNSIDVLSCIRNSSDKISRFFLIAPQYDEENRYSLQCPVDKINIEAMYTLYDGVVHRSSAVVGLWPPLGRQVLPERTTFSTFSNCETHLDL